MRFLVSGDSMLPAYPAGSRLFVSRTFYILCKLRVGDVVVLHDPRDGRLILKRIQSENSKEYLVIGDNSVESTDSRHFGPVKKEDIIGKVMFQYPRNRKGWLVVFIIFLAIVGLLDSLYLTYAHYQEGGVLMCGPSSGGCNEVTTSEYSVVMGIPLAAFGVLFYMLVLTAVLSYKKKKKSKILKILIGWAALGFGVSIYLTYLQALVFHAYCLLCLASAASSTFIFLSTILLAKEGNNRTEARV